MHKNYRKAFTLVELLVVIAIVGLLSTVAAVSLDSSRKKARFAAGQKLDADIQRTVGGELVGEWLFNEGSGAAARDTSGNGFHGTITSPAWVAGVDGTAFSGVVGRYVSLGNDPALNPSNMTITAWIKPGDFNAYFLPIYSNSRDCCGTYNGINFFMQFNKLKATTWNSSPLGITSVATISNDPIWTFVAFSYDGINMKLYVNGRLDATVARANAIGSPASWGSYIGAAGFAPAGYSINGAIDQLRLYSSALVATDIEDVYLAQKDNFLARK